MEENLPEPWDIRQILRDTAPRVNINVDHPDDQYTLRIAKLEGSFPQHTHDGDESWFIFRGAVRFEAGGKRLEVSEGQGLRIPAGIAHSPTCLVPDTLVLIVHRKGFATHLPDPLASTGYRELDLLERAER